MSLLTRLKDRMNGQAIIADDDDAEWDNIINCLAGVSTNKSIRVRSNDNSFAAARFDQLGNNHILELFADGVEVGRVEKDGDLVLPQLTGAAGIYTFGNIIVGPNSNPTTDNQFARKKYVDDKLVPFVLPFFLDDPSTFALNNDNPVGIVGVRLPAMVGGFLSKIVILRTDGTHTSGGTVTFKPRIFNNSSLGSGVSFNDTNNAANTPYSDDFTDVSVSEGNYILFHITARSGTITERRVWINIEGYRKVS